MSPKKPKSASKLKKSGSKKIRPKKDAKPSSRQFNQAKQGVEKVVGKLGEKPGKKPAENPSQDMQSKVRFLDIDDQLAGQRIDNFLFREFKGVPKSRIYRAIRDGEIRVNKKRIKQSYRLDEGDYLRLPPLRVAQRPVHRCSDQLLQELEQAILYEDAGLIVINKPSGLAVHGGSGIQSGLIEALRQMRPDCKRLELVHRLDRDTSGCTLVSKKPAVLRYLHQQLREKTMHKHYLALVKGRWPKRKNMVSLSLEKNVVASGERMVRVSPEGKASKTAYEVIVPLQGATLVKASPITGRTHQIRVHCQASGYPILGDVKYCPREFREYEKSIGLDRLFLHASDIEFKLPDDERWVKVHAPLPSNLSQVVEGLRIQEA